MEGQAKAFSGSDEEPFSGSRPVISRSSGKAWPKKEILNTSSVHSIRGDHIRSLELDVPTVNEDE
jgi:hypothetical protein